MMGAYLIKNIDHELWRKFKSACAYYDLSIKDVFIQHIRNIVIDFEAHKRSLDAATHKLKIGGKTDD